MSDILDNLPFRKKSAGWKEIVAVSLAIAFLVKTGWVAKAYFDENHASTLAAINAIGGRIDAHDVLIKANTTRIEQVRRGEWSNSDMGRWAAQLAKLNRTVPPSGLDVPDVPPPLNLSTAPLP